MPYRRQINNIQLRQDLDGLVRARVKRGGATVTLEEFGSVKAAEEWARSTTDYVMRPSQLIRNS